jgi:arginase
MPGPLTLLGVPIDSVGRAGGTELAPAAFRSFLRPGDPWDRDGGDLDVRIRGDLRDPSTGIVGSGDVLAMTRAVADAVAGSVAGGERPFLIGGCCSFVPGAVAGASRAAGPTAIAYVDGHLDLYDGATSPTGEAADMPMAVVLGAGPPAWVEAAGATTEGRHAAILGYRDLDEALGHGHPHPDTVAGLTYADAEAVLADPSGVGAAVAERFGAAPGRLWVHLDVDVLDEEVFPATDYLMPGGLGLDPLTDLLRPLLGSPALVGASFACYNPEKDPDGACGSALAQVARDTLVS